MSRYPYHRKKGPAPRKPLRSLRELSQDLGAKPMTLALLINKRGGPKQRLATTGVEGRLRWFDAAEFKAWWEALPEDVRAKVPVPGSKTAPLYGTHSETVRTRCAWHLGFDSSSSRGSTTARVARLSHKSRGLRAARPLTTTKTSKCDAPS